VKVEPAGSLNPIGTPDFAETFVDETVVVEPLLNDISPSGAQLALAAIEEPGGSTTTSFTSDTGTISFSSSSPGIHYIKYTLSAGPTQSVGIVRVNVLELPADEEIPPVAVKDIAYLRGDEPTTVSVLSNDVSPSGRVLAVQSVEVPAEYRAKGLVVELLASTSVRVTSPAALTAQASFTYTISDGVSTASAGVSVVPVPALTKHQPPVALDDAARVRVGDIVTVDVLGNDYHPDDSSMFLDEELISEPSDGIAFVSRDTVRYQAPREPGEYRLDYRVLDPFGETAAASVVFTVVAEDETNNQDPLPLPLVARVLAGNAIRVDVPLSGIDPDGDSAQLLNFPTSPQLGAVGETGPDYFYYEASPAASGTDVFTYEVYDAFGATGVGEIKIAVIPEPDELQEPTAVPDSVSIRPGRVAQVDLMANDSDPQGAPIKVSEELTDVPEGVDAEVLEKRFLVVEAPQEEQSFTIRYELSNDRGGSVMSYVLVQVTEDAPLLPPTATDVPILTKDIAGEETFTVDVLDGYAFNPSGPNSDLVVTVEGPNESAAQLLERNGQIEVTPGEKRQAIAYRVTNEADELSALAFILVPAAVDEDFDDPPYIDPNLPIQYVSMNERGEWDLADIVKVPSGREAWIFDESSVTAVQSNGDPIYVDRDTLEFTPATRLSRPGIHQLHRHRRCVEERPEGQHGEPHAAHRRRRPGVQGHPARVHDAEHAGRGRRDHDPRPPLLDGAPEPADPAGGDVLEHHRTGIRSRREPLGQRTHHDGAAQHSQGHDHDPRRDAALGRVRGARHDQRDRGRVEQATRGRGDGRARDAAWRRRRRRLHYVPAPRERLEPVPDDGRGTHDRRGDRLQLGRARLRFPYGKLRAYHAVPIAQERCGRGHLHDRGCDGGQRSPRQRHHRPYRE
jgi:hypothetical protein